MNYLQLCQRLRMECGLSGNGPSAVTNQSGMDAKLVNWIASAWEEIQNTRNDWRFNWAQASIPVSAGIASYLPDDFNVSVQSWVDSTFAISDGSKTSISRIPFELYDGGATGRPVKFCISPDRRIWLTPTPDKAYTLTADYFRTPQILLANSDVPRLPAHYHLAIVYKAIMYYGGHDEAASLYADAKDRFYSLMNKIESTEKPQIQYGGSMYDY